jgi:hypothetical protein
MYTHQLKTACVWKMAVFPFRSESVLASVASDGSFRASICSSILFGKLYEKHSVFQEQMVSKVEPRGGTALTSAAADAAPDSSLSGTVGMLLARRRLLPADFREAPADCGPERGAIANPRCSLNAVDHCALASDRVLLATGGTCGIVRIKLLEHI